jgi:hypothetical protein
MGKIMYELCAVRKDNPDASCTMWDYSPDELVMRFHESGRESAEYVFNFKELGTGGATVREWQV